MNAYWQRFLKGEQPENDVSPEIYRSWQRSLGYNINPEDISDHKSLALADLRQLRDQQEDFIRAAEDVLPHIFHLLHGKNYSLVLGDKNGFILEALGEGQFLSKAQKIHLSPGGNWGEDVKGTNAIGTALTENMPISVYGNEHFIKENHFLSCWASPILGLSGETIGVLDISGEYGTKERILDLAVLGSKMIEQNLRFLDIERQLNFHKQGSKLALDLLKEGLITVDRYGFINQINPAGASLLSRKREDILGKHVSEIFSAPRGWALSLKEMDLKLQDLNSNTTACFKRLTDASGNPLGGVGTVQINAYSQSQSNPFWIGSCSPKSRQTLERAQKAAISPSSILIQGESGTGKEIIARMIHELSSRKAGPFIALNCAALPSTLLESELFGYAEGAFTGARRGGQAGKFELANHGTIFLDEIGDMPLTAQVALLRLLQEREITRIGDKKPLKLDVRVITASHKNLQELVQNQLFRLDLFYRLKVVTIELPPLRERLEDIVELVPYFIHKFCSALDIPPLGLEDEIYSHLRAHFWPGNVRELENCIEGMVAMCNSSILTVEDLPPELRNSGSPEAVEPTHLLSLQTKQTIIQALAQTHGKISPAARLLGIGRNTLYRKMKEYNITAP